MTISALNSQFSIITRLTELRHTMFDLQRQLATGKKSETYGGLGTDRLNVLSLRQKSSAIDGYLSTISQASLRLTMVQEHLNRLHEISSTTRSDALVSPFDLVVSGQTQLQVSAGEHLDEAVALLNFELGGRYFFSGRDTDQKPVVDADLMLNGDGIRAGLKQLISERNQADLGADGRGRLVLAPPAGGVVTIAEDADPSLYGFKIAGAVNNLSGTGVAGPAGSPPSVDVTFSATPPSDGETLRLLLDLPDGSQETIEFKAVAGVPQNDQEFQIGPDAATTSANFHAALTAKVEDLAQISLQAASSIVAADEFFVFDDANPPRRVAGPPFDSAVADQAATAADTVFWYVGDAAAGLERDSAVAKVDKSLVVSYGTRANEQALGSLISNIAVLAAESFSANDPEDEQRFEALSQRVSNRLGSNNGTQSVQDLITVLGFKQSTLENARVRHLATQVSTEDLIGRIENADSFEVSAKLLRLDVQLQASYEATALISRLSIVNFL